MPNVWGGKSIFNQNPRAMRVGVAKKTSDATVHLLPFTVVPQEGAAMQPARVADYLLVREQGGVLSSSFRGREVKGVRLAVPEGYTGAVMMVSETEAKKPKKKAKYSEDEEGDDDEDGRGASDKGAKTAERTGLVTKTFTHLAVWDHDTPPLDTDNPAEWLRWPQLATAINTPIDEAQVNARTETEPAL